MKGMNRNRDKRRLWAKRMAVYVLGGVSLLEGTMGNAGNLKTYAAERTEIRLDSQETYYSCQWDLKNTGSIQRVLRIYQDTWVRRRPGESNWRGEWNTPVIYEPVEMVTESIAGVDVNVEPAWTVYKQNPNRRTVTVALIDTGVDIGHSELKDAIWVN